MFIKQKSNVMYRDYSSFGFITDNRNYGYETVGHNKEYIGDRILSESGNVFFSALSRKPQSIDELVKKIGLLFDDVDTKSILDDAIEFYNILEKNGFVAIGDTIQECEEKDKKFFYKSSVSQIITMKHEKNTREFFEEYFKGVPQLTSLHMEITSKCNERCIHCYIPDDDKANHMDPNLFYNILEQIKKMKLLHLRVCQYFCANAYLRNDFTRSGKKTLSWSSICPQL